MEFRMENAAHSQSENCPRPSVEGQEWARQLFSFSPLKQRKLSKLLAYSGNYTEKRCLDIGSDNGVVSLMLRDEGGTWSSVDLIPETVTAIRSLVGERVYQTDGVTLPFPDHAFDLVAIVDLLEHIETDDAFVKEVARVLRTGGTLIVNVPDPHEGLLRRIRFALGQTDKAHGHVRAGYSKEALQKLLSTQFRIEEEETYSRLPAELVDTAVTAALDILKGKRTKKGTVFTGTDSKKMAGSFKIYKILYPLFWAAVKLDNLLTFLPANMRIVRATRI